MEIDNKQCEKWFAHEGLSDNLFGTAKYLHENSQMIPTGKKVSLMF